MTIAATALLLLFGVSAGVALGFLASSVRSRRPRRLPPLDDSYRHPGAQIESIVLHRRVP